MIITGLLLNVSERSVTDSQGKPKLVYNITILDNDDPQGVPLKVSLENFEQAEKFRNQIRKEITIASYAEGSI